MAKAKDFGCNIDDLVAFLSGKISGADVVASKILAEISAKITKKRLDLNMTQVDFAKFLNVSQGMVSKWEGSDYNFSIKALANIADSLEYDLEIRLSPKNLVEKSVPNEYKVIQEPEPEYSTNNSGNAWMVPFLSNGKSNIMLYVGKSDNNDKNFIMLNN